MIMKKLIIFMIMMLAISYDAMAQTPQAKITKFWIDQNVDANNGLRAHVNFNLNGWKDKFVHCTLYLYDDSKKAWLDRNYSVLTSNYPPEIRDMQTRKVIYDNSNFNDLQLFIGKDAMQLKKGVNSYYCCVEITIFDEKTHILARSGLQSFKANGTGNLVGCTATTDGFSTSYPYEGMLNDYTNASTSSSRSASKPKSSNVSLEQVFNFRNANGYMELKDYNGKSGLYNHTKDQWVIQPQYSFEGAFYVNADKFGYIVARDSYDKYGVFDTYGKVVIPFKYKYIYRLVMPGFLFEVENMNGKAGIIDANEKTVCPFIYDKIYTYSLEKRPIKKLSEAVLVAKKNGKEGLIDLAGKPITDFIFDNFYIENKYTVAFNSVKENNIFARFDYKGKRFYVDEKFDVIRIEEIASRPTNNTQNKSSNYNSSASNSSIKKAVAFGIFIGVGAAIVDYFSSKSSSSSSSSSSSYSRSSSYSSSSSSSSTSICTYCTGRGMQNCVWCEGSGIRSGGLFEEDSTCHSCKGQGRVWCWHCSGRGTVRN